jgi:hypothetical protein
MMYWACFACFFIEKPIYSCICMEDIFTLNPKPQGEIYKKLAVFVYNC